VTADINYDLLGQLATKPHKHLNFKDDEQYGLMVDGVLHDACNSVNEVMQEARTVQHLCDLASIPEGRVYDAHIDARVYRLTVELQAARERLDRIANWHSRETAGGGMVGGFCNECGEPWPCDTRRMADGSYVDEDGDPS
jgi:hypothetical protein